MNSRHLVLFGVALAALWAASRWRRALQIVMVLLVVEGAIRKWLLPSAQDIVYFAKDVLLLGIYAGYWRERSRLESGPRLPPVLVAAVSAGAVFGILEAFNPNLPNLLVGVLGWKAYFFYIPLLWVVPVAFSTSGQLAAAVRWYAFLSVPIGLLSALQFMSGPDATINAYARTGGVPVLATTFGSSGEVRVTGTFSYISGYASYLLVVAMLILASLTATRWRLRGNLFLYAALTLAILGMFMTGSRGPVFTLALLFPLYGWLGVAREGAGSPTVGRALLGLSLVAALLNYVGSDAIGAFYGRAAGSSSEMNSRILSPFLGPIPALEASGLTGFGIGATHQTAETVTAGIEPYSWLRGNLMEDEPGRVMLELGPLGFFLIYFVRVLLIVVATKQVFRLRHAFHRAIATSCALFFLSQLPGAVVFNVTADLYYWFFAGLLFLVIRLDRPAAAGVKAGGLSTLAQVAAPLGWRPPQA